MHASKMKLFIPFAVLGWAGIPAAAQANVTENQTTSIYVDGVKGLDSNSGAQSSPLQTIQAGINKSEVDNQNGIGVKVVVNPGVYREYVNIGGYKLTTATLTLEAATVGTVVVAGSNLVSGWTEETSAIFEAKWEYNLPVCAEPTGWPALAPIATHAEMVVVNNVPLTQVLAHADLRPGTFFADNRNQLMHVYPPVGTNMKTAVVEAAVRPQTLSVEGRTNVVLRGLIFRHAASCLGNTGVSINSSNNVLVDSVQALWNNWGGLGVFTSNDVTVQNSVASYNGGVGFLGNQNTNLFFSFNESDLNNWRGAQGAFYDWAMGGTKIFSTHGATVQNHFANNNQAEGLFFDTDNKNITINDATLVGNVISGLQIERNEGPILVENSHLCSNGAGIGVLTSEKVSIEKNVFYNNGDTGRTGEAQLFVAGVTGGIVVDDWQTGQAYDLFTTGTVLSRNTLEDGPTGQFLFGTYLDESDWAQFATTLTAADNAWYDPANGNAFKLVNNKAVNLKGWQRAVDTDNSSMWAPASVSSIFACTAPPATFPDFQINLNNGTFTMEAGKISATVQVSSFKYGTVSLSIEGLPEGVSATLSNSKLVSGFSTIAFTATKTAVTQTVPVTVWATDGTARTHSVTFNLAVTPL